MDDHPSPFTFAARLLILVSLVLPWGATGAYFWWAKDTLPPGAYPLILFAMPAIVGGAVFFVLGMALMKWLGIPFYKNDQER